MAKYKKAFKVACELLNGDILYGADSSTIFMEILNKEDFVSPSGYERYILDNLDWLTGERRREE